MTTPTVNIQELENIVQGFTILDEVLKAGSFPGSLAEKTLSAIKFVEALKANQQNVLDQTKAATADSEEKVLDLDTKSA